MIFWGGILTLPPPLWGWRWHWQRGKYQDVDFVLGMH
jgi:hypothetical protein